MSYDEDEPDRRHRVGELWSGWRFLSPLARWETITNVVPHGDPKHSYQSEIYTKETGPDYCWLLYDREKVEAVRPPSAYTERPEIRIIDTGRAPSTTPKIMAVLTFEDVMIPSFASESVLVQAVYQGAGQGWKVVDRESGRTLVTTEHDSKAKAMAAVKAAARAHAKALKVKVRAGDGRARR